MQPTNLHTAVSALGRGKLPFGVLAVKLACRELGDMIVLQSTDSLRLVCGLRNDITVESLKADLTLCHCGNVSSYSFSDCPGTNSLREVHSITTALVTGGALPGTANTKFVEFGTTRDMLLAQGLCTTHGADTAEGSLLQLTNTGVKKLEVWSVVARNEMLLQTHGQGKERPEHATRLELITLLNHAGWQPQLLRRELKVHVIGKDPKVWCYTTKKVPHVAADYVYEQLLRGVEHTAAIAPNKKRVMALSLADGADDEEDEQPH
eukprot:6482465-Amphidinium_carterae.1